MAAGGPLPDAFGTVSTRRSDVIGGEREVYQTGNGFIWVGGQPFMRFARTLDGTKFLIRCGFHPDYTDNPVPRGRRFTKSNVRGRFPRSLNETLTKPPGGA